MYSKNSGLNVDVSDGRQFTMVSELERGVPVGYRDYGDCRYKVLYLISHGHTARGAFQTGIVSGLTEREISVVVVAKKGSGRSFGETVYSHGASLRMLDIPASRTKEHWSRFRNYLYQDPATNPALWEKYTRSLDPRKYSIARRCFTRLYYVVGKVVRRIKPLSRIADYVDRMVNGSERAKKMLLEERPDIVISTRPIDPFEVAVMEEAKNLEINRVMYVLSWDNITTKGVFPVMANHFLTWGAIMNNELKEYYGIQDSQIMSTGVPHFDVHAAVRDGRIEIPRSLLADMGLDDEKPYLLFTMSASYYAPDEMEIIEHLAKSIESDRFGLEMQMVVRPHMVNLMSDRSDPSWLKRLEALPSSRVAVDFPRSEESLLTWYMDQSDMIRLSALIHGASICLNSGSTIAVEAAFMDKPVILTCFDTETWPYWQSARRLADYVHLKKFIEAGGCTVAEDPESLHAWIIKYLSDPSLHRDSRLWAAEQECFLLDGNATGRFVSHIQNILNSMSNA